jgi:exoribonuclease-2
MSEYDGRVIEFRASGTTKLGQVIGEGKKGLHVVDQNGRRQAISLTHVVVSHGEFPQTKPFEELVSVLEDRISAARSTIDSELLWTAISSQQRTFSLEELANLYFGDPTSCNSSAIFRAVLDDPIHFKVRGKSIVPRSPKQVEDQLAAARNREEKEAIKQSSIEWMREVLRTAKAAEIPKEMDGLIRRIEDFLKTREGAEVQAWLAEVSSELAPAEAAIEILSLTGRLREDASHLLILAGIEEQFPQEVFQECARLAPYLRDARRIDCTTHSILTIDDDDTSEIDDAISVDSDGEKTRIGIHIADVVHFVEKDDLFDREAFRRSTSVYLPDRTVSMLPQRLCSDLASLNQDCLRPAMSFLLEFGEDGEILDWSVSRSQVTVSQRLSYDEADALMDSPEDSGLKMQLLRLSDLAAHSLRQRQARGALTINRPELKITLVNGEIDVKVIDSASSPSRRMVSEMMILANSLAAQYATREKIPIIFRLQNAPSAELTAPEKYDPVALSELFQKLEPSRFSIYPQPHAGLALPAYTQLTSPIRRFTDLVIQRQIAAHLSGLALPYELQELMEVLGNVQAAEGNVRAVERKAKRLYVLRYLEQRRQEALQAVIIKRLPAGYLVETSDLFVRAQLVTSAGFEPGQVVDARIDLIQPEKEILTLTPV